MSEYDYVIVGSGPAGCVLANRLSRDNEVLVLEAGKPDDDRMISVPAGHLELTKSEHDWDFSTTPQPGLNDRSIYMGQGKVLGGGGSINALVYVRGLPCDHDAWAEETGDDGWSHESVLEHYESVEDSELPGYGTGDGLHVERHEDPYALSETLLEAAEEVGFERTENYNASDRRDEVGFTHIFRKNDKRHSPVDAFLKPVLDRSSLTTETGALAHRVEFDGDRATGVTYEQGGTKKEATASEEVIVAGGAINSPKLLMLSGVGPADHLEDHGIDVKADLPVGRNLQDHLLTWLAWDAPSASTLDNADSILNVIKYFLLKRGPFTTNGTEVSAFWRSEDGLDDPDIKLDMGAAKIKKGGLGDPSGKGYSIGVSLMSPESRGRVALDSTDPEADPVIDPQYMTEDDDLEATVRGVRKAIEIGETDALSQQRDELVWPEQTDDESIREHIRQQSVTFYHPVGTCKMGDDETAVVDGELRVRGLDGLRVVDSSVMPRITHGNTMAPTLMVAERASKLITDEA